MQNDSLPELPDGMTAGVTCCSLAKNSLQSIGMAGQTKIISMWSTGLSQLDFASKTSAWEPEIQPPADRLGRFFNAAVDHDDRGTKSIDASPS